MLKIVVVGVSYKTAPIEIREKLAFNDSNIEESLLSLYEKESIDECCIVSTCNRVEVYVVTLNEEKVLTDVLNFFKELNKDSDNNYDQYVYSYSNSDAVKHLFRVASGMESMVIGEPQIFGQVKEFYKFALKYKTSGLILNRLFNKTFFISKKIRTETKIASEAISVSYLAVELAKRIFEDLSKRSVMLVGTGDMCELAAKHLITNGIGEIYVTSRKYENAVKFSQNLQGVSFKIEEIFYYLKKVDIVITATGSADYIIKPDHVKQSLKLRKYEPMFMIDIAVPRDIDPKVNNISEIYLYDIDDLKNISDENLEIRKKSIRDAEKLILTGEKSFMNWMNSIKLFPTIIDLKRKIEMITKEELHKTFNKMGMLNDKDKALVEQLASSIAGKVLHNPITKLKSESSSYNGLLYSEVIRQIFELNENQFLVQLKDNETKNRN